MNEALTILPIYDMKNDTYFGNTQFGREIVTDIQECIYTGPTVVTNRLKSLYISTSNESDYDDDDGVLKQLRLLVSHLQCIIIMIMKRLILLHLNQLD